jgi:hypothetical protein
MNFGRFATHCAAILCFGFPPSAMGRNQLDSVVFFEFLIEPIRVIGTVFNEGGGQLVKEACCQNFFHQL